MIEADMFYCLKEENHDFQGMVIIFKGVVANWCERNLGYTPRSVLNTATVPYQIMMEFENQSDITIFSIYLGKASHKISITVSDDE